MKRKLKTCKDCKLPKYIFSKGRCKNCNQLFKINIKNTITLGESEHLNTYSDSTGKRWNVNEIDFEIKRAKINKLENFLTEHGYIFCEDCLKNNAFKFDCSHEISVKECKEIGKVELSWDENNIKIRCRKCHQIKDGLS